MSTPRALGLAFLVVLTAGAASGQDNIDPADTGAQHAWGENVGWLNAEPKPPGGALPGVLVTDATLTGFIWLENVGWLSLSCQNTASCGTAAYGVANDGIGNLSGFAWGENIGWVDFRPSIGGVPVPGAGVAIDPTTGVFHGHAWAENLGWIGFTLSTPGLPPFQVQTSWRAPLDLAITKTDGQTTAVAGQPVTYTIVVSNAGPNTALNATVIDTPPSALSSVSWTCNASFGSACPPSGAGAINHAVNIAIGGTLTYGLTGTLSPSATGTLVNTASVVPPAGVPDVNAGNNAASDTDTIVPGGDINVSPTLINFGDQRINTPSAPVSVQVQNLGTGDLTLGSMAIGSPEFQLSGWPGGPVVLPPTGSLTVSVTFSPTLPGAVNANLTILSDDPDESPLNVGLLGVGTTALIGNLVPPSLVVAFGNVSVGSTSAPQTVSFDNVGTAPLLIQSLPILGADASQFSLVAAPSTPFVIAPAGSQSLSVVCSPTSGGAKAATLRINSDADNTPVVDFSLSCTGVPTADLSASITDGQATAVPGQAVTYTIAAANAGPDTASGAAVTDVLPVSLTGAAWTCVASAGSSCAAAGAGNINDTVTLLAGGTATYTLTATIDAAATGSLVNTASVAPPGGTTDPQPGNDSATDTDTLTPQADLAVATSDQPDPVGAGAVLTYSLVLTNFGPSASTGMTLTDALAPEVTFVSSIPGAPVCNQAGGVVTCGLPGLAPGASQTVTLEVTVNAGTSGTITNLATVAGVEADPVSGNDSDTEHTTVTAPSSDLSIAKTDGQAAAVPGTPLTYTLVVANAGPDDVASATVTDTLPAILTGATWTCVGAGGGTCTASGAGNIADNVDLPVGATATYTLTATVDPAATGSLQNTASVAVPPGASDPNPGNDSVTDADALTPEADLGIESSAAPDPVGAGQPLTYTLHLANNGPSTSTGMSLADTLPPQVTFVSSSPGAPACNETANVVTCILPGLAPSAGQTVTLQVTVNPGTLGSIVNLAAVAGNETDPISANDTDTQATSVELGVEGELNHGTRLLADLGSVGGVADEDLYRINQAPYSSYEVLVDATSGDIGTGQGPVLQRLASDGATVVQSSVAAGFGASRSLRWENDAAAVVSDELVRVRSAACTTACDPEDVYRILCFDTTLRLARFNNGATQATVLVLQNTGAETVTGHAHFWSTSGTLIGTQAFSMGPRAAFVVNTSTVPGVAGQGGTITLSHDGPYGTVVGKAVAVDATTGFSFDTALEPRIR